MYISRCKFLKHVTLKAYILLCVCLYKRQISVDGIELNPPFQDLVLTLLEKCTSTRPPRNLYLPFSKLIPALLGSCICSPRNLYPTCTRPSRNLYIPFSKLV